MSITTVQVTCQANRPDGTPIAGALFRFLLSEPDTQNGVIVPREVTGTADSTGLAIVSLWPNGLGSAGTVYRVLVSDPLGVITSLGICTVPNSACSLYQIIDVGAPPTLDQATVAKLAAQQSAAEASASAAASQASRVLADTDVVLTHADVLLTAADRVQTGLDRTQTGLDKTSTAADRVQTGLDRVQTGVDKTATAADRVQTGLDRTQTGLDKAATAADRVQTGLDRTSVSSDRAQADLDAAATSADRVQTGLDRVQTGLDKASTTASAAAANTSAGASAGSAAQALAIYGSTTQQQAAVTAAESAKSAAQGYAASAASVVTQDLSGITAQALHRSPNAVPAIFVYDTSKDSDGGAWTEKCQNTSWYNEPLNGKWLGAAATEAAARAVSGATTGDYFQLTTDGKFYKLNATSGTTEVFRGNKAKFPKLIGIVAESANVTLYDLTEAGRPMWMRVIQSANAGIDAAWYFSNNSNTSCVSAVNGVIAFGNYYIPSPANGNGGLSFIHYPSDKYGKYGSSSSGYAKGGVINRNLAQYIGINTLPFIVNCGVNAVAMTILPDAPLDPVTGLQVPTIAVATNGGVSVIKHDGSVVSTSGYFESITISSFLLTVARSFSNYDHWVAFNPGSLSASFALNSSYSNQFEAIGATSRMLSKGKSTFIKASANKLGLRVLDGSMGAIGKHLSALITPTFNTGYLVGDIRRAYLADSVVESINGSSLITGNSSNFASGIGNWVASTTEVLTAVGGKLTWTGSTSHSAVALPLTTLIPGRTYTLRFSMDPATPSRRNYRGAKIGTSKGAYDIYNAGVFAYSDAATNSYALTFTIPTSVSLGSTLWLYIDDADSGGDFSSYTSYLYNISLIPYVYDRSYKSASATVYGTLTKALTNTANQVVAYSGFSTANYIQEPYSADLDFGTGEWNVSAWVNIPVTLPIANFPVVGSELVTNGTFDADLTGWTSSNFNWNAGQAVSITGTNGTLTQTLAVTIGKTYKVSASYSAANGGSTLRVNFFGQNFDITSSLTALVTATTTTITVQSFITPTSYQGAIDNISVLEVSPALIASRAYSTGSSIKFGINGSGQITAIANDGTTTRTVTTTAAYNNATFLKARVVYKTDGSLAITVNGVQVAITYGNPLLTLNNSNAVLTIGNSYALDAPFPGSIAMLKLSATAPTQEQSVWMYEQEKQLFRDGANCLLPDSGNIVDLAYDEVTDKWIAASATNESTWTGLVRTGVTAVPAGSNTKVQAGGGVKLNARSSTSPGVDVTIPPYGLREELVKRGEAAARLSRLQQVFDYIGGFTCTTVNGNTAVTAVAGSGYPAQTTIKNAVITGSGIPASTYIVDLVSTTAYLSAKATASASAVQVSFTDFVLPVGYETVQVSVAGVVKTEGSTKDFTRLFDGFRETIRFGTAPGYNVAVQIRAVRSAT